MSSEPAGAGFIEIDRRRRAAGILVALDEVTYRAPDGRPVSRDVVDHPGGVGVLPVDGHEVVLVRQFRAGVAGRVLEIPAGKRDRTGEAVDQLAVRELREEVGLVAGRLVPLGTICPSPAYTSEVIHLFAALDLEQVDRAPDGVEEDHAEIVRLPFERACDMARRGELTDAKTVVALLRWAAGSG
jgi:ADP-ribose pyrophosphatase